MLLEAQLFRLNGLAKIYCQITYKSKDDRFAEILKEHTAPEVGFKAMTLIIDSPTMLGAQREVTAYYKDKGYTPIGRWEWDEGNVYRQYKNN